MPLRNNLWNRIGALANAARKMRANFEGNGFVTAELDGILRDLSASEVGEGTLTAALTKIKNLEAAVSGSGVLTADLGGNDPDAQAFIDAAGVTGETQQAALNTYVLDLKSSGVWDKMDAIYPMCPIDGSTATRDAYKWNLKDPRDLDAAFRITWVNNPTASQAGITGNGSSMYGDTHYTPSLHAIDSDACFGFYGTKSNKTDMGTRDTDLNYTSFNNTSIYGCHGGFSNNASLSLIKSFCMIQRDNSSSQEIYQNSSTANATDTKTISTRPSRSYFLMALNSGSALNHSAETYSMFFIGKSLTGSQITSFITSIENYNTALGR